MTEQDLQQHEQAFMHAARALMSQGERPDAPQEMTIMLGGLAVAVAAIASGYKAMRKELK
jgi:hypothetical protein